jgi:hypothetical protein
MYIIKSKDIGDNQILARHLADGILDTAELADGAVTGAKIADDAVDSEHIAAGALDNEHYAANSITGDKLDDSLIKIATGTLTASQVRLLFSAPQTIIAARGAGQLVVLDSLLLELNYGGTAFDAVAANRTIRAYYTGKTTALSSGVAGNTFGGATADTVAVATPTGVIMAAADCVNLGIDLAVAVGEWAAADDDANGNSTLTYTAHYHVVDVSF